MNEDDLEQINDRIVEAKVQDRILKSEYDGLVGRKDEAIEEYDKRINEYMFLVRDELIKYARTIGLPSIKYYNIMFNDEHGDCHNIR